MTANRARYRVVALATTLAMVTYLDRVAIGTLAPGIRKDLGLTAVEMGWLFTAFQLAYGLFEVPTRPLGRWSGNAPSQTRKNVIASCLVPLRTSFYASERIRGAGHAQVPRRS